MTTSTITVTRIVGASADRVFAAWTDAEQLAAWWWPQLAGTTYDVDVRPGGRFRIPSPAIKVRGWGVYTQVVVTFEPDEHGTRVTVAHTSSEHVPEGGAEQGWNDVLDRMVQVVGQPTSSRS